MRDSPLTNLRSVGSSLAFHLGLIVLLSLAVLGVTVPVHRPPPTVLQGDLGPVDNRVKPQSGGGGPGDLGGMGPQQAVRVTAMRGLEETPIAEDRAIQDLLEGTNPRPAPASSQSKPVPGLDLSQGVGTVPGPGLGGGGGSGGGSGGGTGPGIGPSTEFFGTRARGRSFVYVIDRSGSMSAYSSLRVAKQELISSLDQLPPDALFAVLFYNIEPTPILDEAGRFRLRPATMANKEQVRRALADVSALGGTDHAAALRAAFPLKPDILFFLTDARMLEPETAEALRPEARSIHIQIIEFGEGPELKTTDPLKGLALATGGAYRYIDVLRYQSRNGGPVAPK